MSKTKTIIKIMIIKTELYIIGRFISFISVGTDKLV